MTVQTRTLHEIDRAGRAALVRELGVVDALRFIGQYSSGTGDYTEERKQWLEEETTDALFDQIKEAEQNRQA